MNRIAAVCHICSASVLGWRSNPINPEIRMSAYYGLFFLSIGSVMPFAALWFESLNLTPLVSGSIFAAPSVAIVLFTIFIGRWADRLSDWRTAIIACNWIVLVLFCWFLFRVDSWDIIIIWTLAGLFIYASSPIMDAAALNLTTRRGSDYGRIRAYGSIGFIFGVLASGVIFEQVGIKWFVAVLVLTTSARVFAAHGLPRFRAPQGNPALSSNDALAVTHHGSAPQVSSDPDTATLGIAVLRHRGIALVIIGAALLNGSHGFNNIFAVVHWTSLGISTSMASVLWAVGVIAEVLLMWSFKSLAKLFSARKCLLFASVICIVRWLLTGTDPSLSQLFLLQILHSITFGLSFMACVNFIARRVPEQNAAQAQAVYGVLVTAFMAIAMWLSGWLYEQIAGKSYWAMAIMALAGGICVALSFASNLHDPANSSLDESTQNG